MNTRGVFAALLAIMALWIGGCAAPAKTAPPYVLGGMGTVHGSVASVGSDTTVREDEAPVALRYFCLRWDKRLRPRESEFVMTPSTVFIVDGRRLDVTTSEMARILSNDGPHEIAVSFVASSALPASAESPRGDYRYAEATRVVLLDD